MPASVRIPRRVADAVLTSDAASRPDVDPLGARLVEVVRESHIGYGGTTLVPPAALDDDLQAVLREYAETLDDAARNGEPGPDALADINAARAMLRTLDRLAATG